MRHFDHKSRKLLNVILKLKGGAFGKRKWTDYFSRLEFQMRGSPHSQGLYWVENSPEFIEDDEPTELICSEFIDEYATFKHL